MKATSLCTTFYSELYLSKYHQLQRGLSDNSILYEYDHHPPVLFLLHSVHPSIHPLIHPSHQHDPIIILIRDHQNIICNRMCEIESIFGELPFRTGTHTHLSAEYG